MSRSEDVNNIRSERLDVGTGTAIGLTVYPGQLAVQIKLLAGGTLEIGGQSQTAGTMYPLSASEVWNGNLSGQIWLYATGATCTAAIIRGKTAGT